MKKTEIKIEFRWDGSISPLEFKVGDKKIQIKDMGRRWDTDDGKHLLVMDFNDETYHLFFEFVDLTWYLVEDIMKPPDPA